MTATDIVLILLLGGGFLVGFFQGMVRGLLAIGSVVPLLGTLLGAFVPQAVRDAMA